MATEIERSIAGVEYQHYEYVYEGDRIVRINEQTFGVSTGYQEFEYDAQGRVIYYFLRGAFFIDESDYDIVEEAMYITYNSDNTASVRFDSTTAMVDHTLHFGNNGKLERVTAGDSVYEYTHSSTHSAFASVTGYQAISHFIAGDFELFNGNYTIATIQGNEDGAVYNYTTNTITQNASNYPTKIVSQGSLDGAGTESYRQEVNYTYY